MRPDPVVAPLGSGLKRSEYQSISAPRSPHRWLQNRASETAHGRHGDCALEVLSKAVAELRGMIQYFYKHVMVLA
jgi:hypothetical protein